MKRAPRRGTMASRIFGLLGAATALFTTDPAADLKDRKHKPKSWMPVFRHIATNQVSRPLTDRPKVRERKLAEEQMKALRYQTRRKHAGGISAEYKHKLPRGGDYRIFKKSA